MGGFFNRVGWGPKRETGTPLGTISLREMSIDHNVFHTRKRLRLREIDRSSIGIFQM
jgi:hypothetical protein